MRVTSSSVGWLAEILFAGAAIAQAPASGPSEQEISESYIYLLGRLLGLRQQQLDFKQGFKWNQLVHRRPGDVAWPS